MAKRKVQGWLESFIVQLIVVVVMLASVGLTVFIAVDLQHNSSNDIKRASCVEEWANDFTARQLLISEANSILQDASTARNDALDNLVISLTQPSHTPFLQRPEFVAYLKASTAYQGAQNEYANQVRQHPIPPAPQFACQ